MLGSDGRNYASVCHLEMRACEFRSTDLQPLYRGQCNPCQNHICDANPGSECHVVSEEIDEFSLGRDKNKDLLDLDMFKRSPVCKCSANCPQEVNPVCASNGKTVRLNVKSQLCTFDFYIKKINQKFILHFAIYSVFDMFCFKVDTLLEYL